MLASRPKNGITQLGRETFLTKVDWEDGWPVIAKGIGKLEIINKTVGIMNKSMNNYDINENFENKELGFNWISIRNHNEEFYSLIEKKGYLSIKLLESRLEDEKLPAYLCVRQQYHSCNIKAVIDFIPESESEFAGIAIVQSDLYNYQFGKIISKNRIILQVKKCINGIINIVSEIVIGNGEITLEIISDKNKLSFKFYEDGKEEIVIENEDATELSTEKAGGFVGNTIGMYAYGDNIDRRAYFKSFHITKLHYSNLIFNE